MRLNTLLVRSLGLVAMLPVVACSSGLSEEDAADSVATEASALVAPNLSTSIDLVSSRANGANRYRATLRIGCEGYAGNVKVYLAALGRSLGPVGRGALLSIGTASKAGEVDNVFTIRCAVAQSYRDVAVDIVIDPRRAANTQAVILYAGAELGRQNFFTIVR